MPITPGPWKSIEMGSEGARIVPNSKDPREGLKHIAIVNGRDTLTDFANGRLIAAAPEMLSILKLALVEIESELSSVLQSHSLLDSNGDPLPDTLDKDAEADVEHLQELVISMRSAILTAEGR